jgi:hypothetical protein
MKMIEVSYRDGSEWKAAKTKKLCNLLERVYGKNSFFLPGATFEKFMWKHLMGQCGHYKVYKYDAPKKRGLTYQLDAAYYAGEIYIESIGEQVLDEDYQEGSFEEDFKHFFEGSLFEDVNAKMKLLLRQKNRG